VSAVSADINTACGTTTWNLMAGQTIDVGSVTVKNDTDNLYVTYTLDYPNATFGTLHLWVGNDLANLPKNSQGTPVPGQFPYKPDATGQTSYTVVIPLTDLSIADVTKACPLALYVVAHAEVVNVNGNNETAFGGDLTGSSDKGRWWYYGKYNVCCNVTPPPPVIGSCQTAFAKGGYVFTTDPKSNPEKLPSLNLIKNRWGWAINLKAFGETTYPIYAGAGLNNTANGIRVGTLTVNWDGEFADIEYTLDNHVMKELHIYASDFKPTTVAPGQYGMTQYFNPPVDNYDNTFNVRDSNGDGIWLIVHSLSCELVAP